MPMIDADFEDIEKPLPVDSYPFEVTGATMKQTKKDSSNMIMWELTVLSPPDYAGRKLWHNSNLSDNKKREDGTPDKDAARKSRYFLKVFLDTIKCPYDPKSFDTEKAIHCKGIARVDIEEYEGRPVNRVKEILPYQQ
jgi:hypothetical protein